MSVYDPGKKFVGMISTNPIGALAGAGVSYLALKKYMPGKKWYIQLGVIVAGSVGGAYAQMSLSANSSAKAGAKKSEESIKK